MWTNYHNITAGKGIRVKIFYSCRVIAGCSAVLHPTDFKLYQDNGRVIKAVFSKALLGTGKILALEKFRSRNKWEHQPFGHFD